VDAADFSLNPETFPFPVIHETVTGVSLERLLQGDPTLMEPLTAAALRLAASGASAISSGCGFFILFQEALCRRMQIPVALSSLLQIPLIQQLVGPHRRIGVLTAHAGRLSETHLRMGGMDPRHPVKVVGLEAEPHFQQGVLTPQGAYHDAKIEAEVLAKAEAFLESGDGGPPVGAVLLECTNLPPFAAAIQETLGLPVFDITTLIAHLHQALIRCRFS